MTYCCRGQYGIILQKGGFIMKKSICGINCETCPQKISCGGCGETAGHPFGSECIIAICCQNKSQVFCSDCSHCKLKTELIDEFNSLGIEDMEKVTDLNSLLGSYINLEYTLPNGQKIKFLDDTKSYLGNQICKKNSNRWYGLAADENYLLICEYGENGTDAEIVIYKKR